LRAFEKKLKFVDCPQNNSSASRSTSSNNNKNGNEVDPMAVMLENNAMNPKASHIFVNDLHSAPEYAEVDGIKPGGAVAEQQERHSTILSSLIFSIYLRHVYTEEHTMGHTMVLSYSHGFCVNIRGTFPINYTFCETYLVPHGITLDVPPCKHALVSRMCFTLLCSELNQLVCKLN
jgi:hypothetical protein